MDVAATDSGRLCAKREMSSGEWLQLMLFMLPEICESESGV